MSAEVCEEGNELKDIPTFEELLKKLQKTIKIAWNIDNKIHQPSIEKWLDNFTGAALSQENDTEEVKREAAKREKQLALFLLCNFVYYNENEIKHLTRLMFKKLIHSYCTILGKSSISEEEIYALLENTKFSYLGEISESSSYLLYLFRQENALSRKVFSDNHTAENIVYIDDFSISGRQAVRYLKSRMQNNQDNTTNYYVLLMVATVEAVQALNELENVTVLPCIILDEAAKAFSKESVVFAEYGEESKSEARKMCEYYGEKIKTTEDGMTTLGFGGCGYLFGSYYNVPNNTLPIFWSSINNWFSIFKRHDKQYFKSNVNWGGHYV